MGKTKKPIKRYCQCGEPFDPDLLEELVTDLLHMATQKTAG